MVSAGKGTVFNSIFKIIKFKMFAKPILRMKLQQKAKGDTPFGMSPFEH
jgi:hypothetical protein